MVVQRDPARWTDGYRAICAHPIARRMSMIEDD